MKIIFGSFRNTSARGFTVHLSSRPPYKSDPANLAELLKKCVFTVFRLGEMEEWFAIVCKKHSLLLDDATNDLLEQVLLFVLSEMYIAPP